jgi:soluble lytic murein transglycosylase-like protein
MLPSEFQGLTTLYNLTVRFCLILVIAMPAFAASPERSATVVRADQKSGRLVRSVVQVASIPVNPVSVPSLTIEPKADETPVLAPEPQGDASWLVALVDRIAGENGVEGSLVHSVIRAESNYNTRAVSPKGAQGMMQLIPATAHRFGVTNSFDPAENIQGGVRYLKFLWTTTGTTTQRRSPPITREKARWISIMVFRRSPRHRIMCCA